jgi:hypothetical protein
MNPDRLAGEDGRRMEFELVAEVTLIPLGQSLLRIW